MKCDSTFEKRYFSKMIDAFLIKILTVNFFCFAIAMIFRQVISDDEQILLDYFNSLSEKTKLRYGPHPFDRETISGLCQGDSVDHLYYVALNDNKEIIAYTIVKKGYVEADLNRFHHYNVNIDHENDYTIAPSVADAWQSKGVGSKLFKYVEQDLVKLNARSLVLWGGVQESNLKAVNFYKKYGFVQLDRFEHNGSNLDMAKHL